MGKLSIYHLVGDSDGEMEGGRQVEVILGHRNSGGEAGRKDFERRTQQKYKSESRDNLIVQRSIKRRLLDLFPQKEHRKKSSKNSSSFVSGQSHAKEKKEESN